MSGGCSHRRLHQVSRMIRLRLAHIVAQADPRTKGCCYLIDHIVTRNPWTMASVIL